MYKAVKEWKKDQYFIEKTEIITTANLKADKPLVKYYALDLGNLNKVPKHP